MPDFYFIILVHDLFAYFSSLLILRGGHSPIVSSAGTFPSFLSGEVRGQPSIPVLF